MPPYPGETFPVPSPTSCPSCPYALLFSLFHLGFSFPGPSSSPPVCTLFLFHSAAKYLINTRNLQIQIYWTMWLLGFLEGVEAEEAVTCYQATGLWCCSTCSPPPGPLPRRCHRLPLLLTAPSHIPCCALLFLAPRPFPISGSQILVPSSSFFLPVSSNRSKIRLSDALAPASKSPPDGFKLLDPLAFLGSCCLPLPSAPVSVFPSDPLPSGHFSLCHLGGASQFLCPLLRGHLFLAVHLEPPGLLFMFFCLSCSMEGAVSSQSLEHTLIFLVRKEEREERKQERRAVLHTFQSHHLSPGSP